jgi:FkbM family methyltransferase
LFHRAWTSVPGSLRARLLPHILGGIQEVDKFRFGLPTMDGLLRNAAANGFAPGTIVDIGANVGDWSRMASSIFPAAHIFMIEGNPDHSDRLRAAQSDIRGKSDYAIAVLGPEDRGEVNFHIVGPRSVAAGSGVLPELTTFDKTTVKLPMRTLDGLVDRSWNGRPVELPVLMKLDVQGFELEVLRGGSKLLSKAELVILETALISYNAGGALFAEVIQFMANNGFVTYDFCGQFRRQTDSALFQTDVAFVKIDSDLRRPRKFWLNEP